MNELGNLSDFRVEDFNASVEFTETAVTSSVVSSRLSIFLLCFLGLPGNLLVIAVYLRQMATSTRVYMFALGIVDTVACICGLIWSMGKIGSFTVRQILFWFGHLSVLFSVLLLAFVSVERLLAVRHPHTFTLSAPRAKKALVVIAVVAAVCSTATVVPKVILRRPVSAERFIPIFVALSCIVFMIICYTLVALTLLRKARIARTQVSVIQGMSSTVHTIATVSSSFVTNADRTAIARTLADKPSVGRTVADRTVVTTTPMTTNLAATYRSVSLMFIITVIFIACWVPQFISFFVPVLLRVRLIFLLNSAINPFVYTMASSMFRNDVRNLYRQTRIRLAVCRC